MILIHEFTMRTTRFTRRLPSVAVIALAAGLSGISTSVVATSEDSVSAAEVDEVVEVIRKAYDEAREGLEQLPGERFETGPALEAADYDGRAIVTWIERNTRWVPYRGVLRGADGVLLDRQGNSLDRSLLLARLLEDAGYDTRLLRGRLSAEAVERLLSRSTTTADESRLAESFFPDDVLAAAERARSQAAALASVVEPARGRASPGIEEAAADHWWVEAKLEDGWTEVDPLLTGPLAVMRPEPLDRISPDSLPDSLFHQVTIRVVIERWDAGETVEEVPLEYTLQTAEAAYHDLELQFIPFHYEAAPEESPTALEALAIAETTEEWLPVLRRGTDTTRQQGFDRDGNLERNPARVATARKMEEVTSALEGVGRANEPDATYLTAAWLEYRIEVPGMEPDNVRRELFDLIGPARRASDAIAEFALDPAGIRERGRSLLGIHRILVTSAELPPVAFEKASRELWARHGPQIAAFVRLMRDSSAEELLHKAYREPLVALDLLGLATARHLLSPHRSATYLASPNVLTTHFMVELGESFSVRRAYDLVVNEVGASVSGSVPAARVRLEQGVLDTALEAAMSEPDERSGNAAQLFALRGEATGEWHRVDAASSDVALPDTARARIAAALASGRIVVVPGKLGPDLEAAWWEIDPATGTTLGIGSRGWGASAPEDVEVRTVSTAYVSSGTHRIGWTVNCRILGAFLRTAGHMTRNAGGGWSFSAEAMGYILEYGCGGSPLLRPKP